MPRHLVEKIIATALRAPSGGNTQPWHLYVVSGRERQALCEQALEALDTGRDAPSEFALYPAGCDRFAKGKLLAFYERRSALAREMYALQGISSNNRAARTAAMRRNFTFFGASVGIFVTVDKQVDKNGWGHVGMLINQICLVAEEFGLATCLQEAWAHVNTVVYDFFQIDTSEVGETLWCGIALGHPDLMDPVNSLVSSRESLDTVATFRGFPDSRL